MGESVVTLEEEHSFQPVIVARHQASSIPVPDCQSPRPLPASYPARRETEIHVIPYPPRIDGPTNVRSSSHDSEKGSLELNSHHTHDVPYSHSRIAFADPEDDGDDGPKEHAIWIMVGNLTCDRDSVLLIYLERQIYLSALSPLLALPIAFYALILGISLLLLLPLCLCLNQWPICTRFRHFLSPLLVFQLGLIYSSYDLSSPVKSETSDIMVLILVSILSPLYAMAIAVATWVAGVFWFYTAILGNPDGNEDRDDGREAVLAVRGCWEKWLIRSLESQNNRPEEHGC